MKTRPILPLAAAAALRRHVDACDEEAFRAAKQVAGGGDGCVLRVDYVSSLLSSSLSDLSSPFSLLLLSFSFSSPCPLLLLSSPSPLHLLSFSSPLLSSPLLPPRLCPLLLLSRGSHDHSRESLFAFLLSRRNGRLAFCSLPLPLQSSPFLLNLVSFHSISSNPIPSHPTPSHTVKSCADAGRHHARLLVQHGDAGVRAAEDHRPRRLER